MFWDILSHYEFIGQKLNLFYEYFGIYVYIIGRYIKYCLIPCVKIVIIILFKTRHFKCMFENEKEFLINNLNYRLHIEIALQNE